MYCPVSVVGGESSGWHVTLECDLAELLVEHYRDDPDVGSVPDALRQAALDVTEFEG